MLSRSLQFTETAREPEYFVSHSVPRSLVGHVCAWLYSQRPELPRLQKTHVSKRVFLDVIGSVVDAGRFVSVRLPRGYIVECYLSQVDAVVEQLRRGPGDGYIVATWKRTRMAFVPGMRHVAVLYEDDVARVADAFSKSAYEGYLLREGALAKMGVTREQRRESKPRPAAPFSLVSRPFLIRTVREGRAPKERPAVVVAVPWEGGVRHVAFYQSTGTGTPDKVQAGAWIPFNGISRVMGGWFVKVDGKVPEGVLQEAAAWLARQTLGEPERVFDERDYPAPRRGQKGLDQPFFRDVNNHLLAYGAFERADEVGAPVFPYHSVNIGSGSAFAPASREVEDEVGGMVLDEDEVGGLVGETHGGTVLRPFSAREEVDAEWVEVEDEWSKKPPEVGERVRVTAEHRPEVDTGKVVEVYLAPHKGVLVEHDDGPRYGWGWREITRKGAGAPVAEA